jgi:hypothetical protein
LAGFLDAPELLNLRQTAMSSRMLAWMSSMASIDDNGQCAGDGRMHITKHTKSSKLALLEFRVQTSIKIYRPESIQTVQSARLVSCSDAFRTWIKIRLQDHHNLLLCASLKDPWAEPTALGRIIICNLTFQFPIKQLKFANNQYNRCMIYSTEAYYCFLLECGCPS